MKRKKNFWAKKENKKKKVGFKKGLGEKKLTRKDWKTLDEYGSLNPTNLEESEEEESLSKYV